MKNQEKNEPIWLFDLDNTLHHADAGIFYLINRKMTEFLQNRLNLSEKEANYLREHYWHCYGATLAGLRLHHKEIDVQEFLQFSHPMSEILPLLQAEENLLATLSALSGKKVIFSNAPLFYIKQLLDKLDIHHLFDEIFGIDSFDYDHKPQKESYAAVCRALNVESKQCIMVDDSAANIHAAKQFGMRTIWYGKQVHALPFTDGIARNMRELLDVSFQLSSI